MNAYRCFVSRRGLVRQIRSDQGTNFVGARNELQQALFEMDHDKLRTQLLKRNCDWVEYKMNFPHSSHMGGAWERQTRTVPYLARMSSATFPKSIADPKIQHCPAPSWILSAGGSIF